VLLSTLARKLVLRMMSSQLDISDSAVAHQDQVNADLLAFIKAHQSSFNPIARMTGAQRAISS
jgi:hypothetical protein